MIFGVPEDGGSTYINEETQRFFKTWGVKHRKSSAYFPHSNARVETMKRFLRDNTGFNGTLNTDKFARALMQYRKTLLQEVGLSPAQILFGRQLLQERVLSERSGGSQES